MFEWFVIIAPIVFGFGSLEVINIMHAGLQDEEHGITHAIPSLLSIHFVYLVYALLIGFTYGWLVLFFPVLLTIMKYGSVVLLVALAYLIWSRKKAIVEGNYMSFKEEFMAQAVTPIVPLIMVIMYSLFLEAGRPLGSYVIAMSIGLVVLSFVTQIFWVAAGMVLDDDVLSEKLLSKLDHIFAGVYGLFALWIVISNFI